MNQSPDDDPICHECEAYSWGKIKMEDGQQFIFGEPNRQYRTISSGSRPLFPYYNPDLRRIEGVRVFCKTCSMDPLIKDVLHHLDLNKPFLQRYPLYLALGNRFLWKKGFHSVGRPRYLRVDRPADQIFPHEQPWCDMCREQTFAIGWYSDWKMSGIDPYWDLMTVTVPNNEGSTHRTLALRYSICRFCSEWMPRKHYEDEFGEPPKKKYQYRYAENDA